MLLFLSFLIANPLNHSNLVLKTIAAGGRTFRMDAGGYIGSKLMYLTHKQLTSKQEISKLCVRQLL